MYQSTGSTRASTNRLRARPPRHAGFRTLADWATGREPRRGSGPQVQRPAPQYGGAPSPSSASAILVHVEQRASSLQLLQAVHRDATQWAQWGDSLDRERTTVDGAKLQVRLDAFEAGLRGMPLWTPRRQWTGRGLLAGLHRLWECGGHGEETGEATCNSES